MKRMMLISWLCILCAAKLFCQDTMRFSGQVSSWLNINSGSSYPLWGGARYIPQLNNGIALGSNIADMELSAGIYGNAGIHPFDSLTSSGSIRPYRIWARYSSDRFELRAGLQKISFGSAAMLRPLMWFDQIDARDPLQLTDGVWGILARYYFLNNANIWLWGLYGNEETRGWESVPGNSRIPEAGGRIQLPVPGGEAALSYNYRTANSTSLASLMTPYGKIPEHRFGFDAKWDLAAGIWIEGTYTHKSKDLGLVTNQMILNAGIDYTFGIKNGLYAACEHLFLAYGAQDSRLSEIIPLSLVTLRYPAGLFDTFSTIIYYNWSSGDVYSFASWQREYDNIILYLMAFCNPDNYTMPYTTGSHNIFSGKGIQFMFVYNY